MAKSKASENYFVVYITQNILDDCNKIIATPSAYLKDDFVTYVPFPVTPEDGELYESFLKTSPTPAAPESWVRYPAVVLASFGIQ